MSNGTGSNLKRGVDTAFGDETDQEARKIRRRRRKASKLHHEYAQVAESAPLEQATSEETKEPAVTQRLSDSDLKAKKSMRKHPKASELLQKSPQNAELAPLQSEPTVAQRPPDSGQKKVGTSDQAVKNVDQISTSSEEREQPKKMFKKERSSGSRWMLTAPEGGRFTNHDPILVHNDGLATPRPCSSP